MKKDSCSSFCRPVVMLLLVLGLTAGMRADVVTDWNLVLLESLATAKTSPLVTTRVTAIVQAAVFDALNGIERRYTPIHVDFAAPRGASQRAAAIQAAYTTLVALFPSQKASLDTKLQRSLAAIASDAAAESSNSIALGIQWGRTVANDIMAWRSTDHFTPAPPPYLGGLAIGQWRPTPPNFLPGAAPQFAIMTPWAINAPDQFRPAGPPALPSAEYATVLNETKTMGALSGSPRTADQTQLAFFWNGNTPAYWNRIAMTISDERHLTLSENARLFALLNLAMADAAIACWDAKYHYVLWRPITAITLADLDGNPATNPDASWQPLLNIPPAAGIAPSFTPAHPEYPSGHSTVSGAAVAVLIATFGDSNPFSVDSENLPGILRSFPSFSAALLEIHNARVFGGIHFRTACLDGSVVGQSVAEFILQNSLQPLHGQHLGQTNHDHGNGSAVADGETQDGGLI